MSHLTPALATVLAACISAASAILVCVFNSRAQNDKLIAELARQADEKQNAEAVRDAKLELRLEAVEKKLDVHNGYAERFAEIGQDIAVIKNDIKTLYKKGE